MPESYRIQQCSELPDPVVDHVPAACGALFLIFFVSKEKTGVDNGLQTSPHSWTCFFHSS